MNTDQLIANLSKEPKARKLQPPLRYIACLLLVMLGYGVIVQALLGVRYDLVLQFVHPFFIIELILLVLLIVTGVVAAILSIYPDNYQQKKGILKLPYIIFAILVIFIFSQLFMEPDSYKIVTPVGAHRIECALCIASVAIVPSALIFGLMRKGASINPLKAGSFAVLATSAMGCIILRFSEANNSLMHLIQWHYFPTLLFAVAGALIGRYLFRW